MIRKWLKTKQAKPILITCVVIILLVVAFFIQPGGDKSSLNNLVLTNSSPVTPANEVLITSSPKETPRETDAIETPQVSALSETALTQVSPTGSKPSQMAETQDAPTETASAKTTPTKTTPIKTTTEPEKTTQIVTPTPKVPTVTIAISCETILNNLNKFNKNKLSVLPENGIILSPQIVVFQEGESVFDILKLETQALKIPLDFRYYPFFKSVYINGINNIYEMDCGPSSGWTYKVNGIFPNYGQDQYILKDGDIIEIVYTCDGGPDVGLSFAGGS